MAANSRALPKHGFRRKEGVTSWRTGHGAALRRGARYPPPTFEHEASLQHPLGHVAASHAHVPAARSQRPFAQTERHPFTVSLPARKKLPGHHAKVPIQRALRIEAGGPCTRGPARFRKGLS